MYQYTLAFVLALPCYFMTVRCVFLCLTAPSDKHNLRRWLLHTHQPFGSYLANSCRLCLSANFCQLLMLISMLIPFLAAERVPQPSTDGVFHSER